MSCRTQVGIIHHTSKPLSITSGVPQGSILGLILLTIYINYLCKMQIKGEILSYAAVLVF